MGVTPDYMEHYRRYWADLVETDGQLDLDKVARELADYSVVAGCASTVFEELAGLSKPNTDPVHVLEAAARKYAETYADDLCDLAAVQDDKGNTVVADALRRIAEEWHPGSWAAYTEGRQRIERLLSARDAVVPKTGA